MRISFLLAALSLNYFISLLRASQTLMSFENTSPHNTWVLKSTGDDIDYIMTHYNTELSPGATEWVELYNTTVKNFIYEVCDSTGSAAILYLNGPGLKCALYSGAMINLTISTTGITAKPIENTAIKDLSVTGFTSPYLINATTTPPSHCDLPYPIQYTDGKLRIINLEGATLDTPQIPNTCDLLYFAQIGVNAVVLPFKWDYLQNFLGQDIPINWASGGYGAQLLSLINAWTAKNYTVIFSMYDRMRYSYCAIGASDCWVNVERYANAWAQIATQLANNSRVIFGLMNNPDVYDFVEGRNNGTRIVLDNQNAAAKAIRATGATSQLLLYAGNGGSNIQNWFDPYDGESNAEMFIPENIQDNHYQLDIDMFYEESKQPPEYGCINSAMKNPQSCINKQNPENFTNWMMKTDSKVIIKKTGGTNSDACIICINQGTTWMMLQNNIMGIGMWVGGHAWLTFNGSTDYALYLAPIHNVPQKQMTLGFQNVSNPNTGELFLTNNSALFPNTKPTLAPTKTNHSRSTFDWQYFSIAMGAGAVFLFALYMLYRYSNPKKSSLLGKKGCCFFEKKESLLHEALLNGRFNYGVEELRSVV